MGGAPGTGRRPHREDQDGGGGVREPAPRGARHGGQAPASEGRFHHDDGVAGPARGDARRGHRAAAPPGPAHRRDPHAPPANPEGEGGTASRGGRGLIGPTTKITAARSLPRRTRTAPSARSPL